MHLHRHLPSDRVGPGLLASALIALSLSWAIPARAQTESITLDQAIQIALAPIAVEFYRGHDDWQLALQPANK